MHVQPKTYISVWHIMVNLHPRKQVKDIKGSSRDLRHMPDTTHWTVSNSVTDFTALKVTEIFFHCRIQQERLGTSCWELRIKINAAAETLSQPGIKTHFLPKCLTIVKSNNNLKDSEKRRRITWMDYICPERFYNHHKNAKKCILNFILSENISSFLMKVNSTKCIVMFALLFLTFGIPGVSSQSE